MGFVRRDTSPRQPPAHVERRPQHIRERLSRRPDERGGAAITVFVACLVCEGLLDVGAKVIAETARQDSPGERNHGNREPHGRVIAAVHALARVITTARAAAESSSSRRASEASARRPRSVMR